MRGLKFGGVIAGLLMATAPLSACAGGSSAGSGGADGDETLRIGVPADVFDVVPVAVAVEEGMFDEQGIDVELEVIHTAVDAVKAMIGGEVDFAATGAPAAIQAVSSGAEVRLVAPIVQTSPYVLMANADWSSLDEIKGHSIAVSDLGSSPDVAARQALAENGIPESEVEFLHLGPNAERLAATIAGSADSVMLSGERVGIAEEQGLYEVADFTEQGIKTVNIALVAREDSLKADPELGDRVREALKAAYAFVVDPDNKQSVIDISADYLEIDGDDPVVQGTYDYFISNKENDLVNSPDGRFDAEALQIDLDASAAANPEAEGLTVIDITADGAVRE